MKRYSLGKIGAIEDKNGDYLDRDDVEDFINHLFLMCLKKDSMKSIVSEASREGFWLRQPKG